MAEGANPPSAVTVASTRSLEVGVHHNTVTPLTTVPHATLKGAATTRLAVLPTPDCVAALNRESAENAADHRKSHYVLYDPADDELCDVAPRLTPDSVRSHVRNQPRLHAMDTFWLGPHFLKTAAAEEDAFKAWNVTIDGLVSRRPVPIRGYGPDAIMREYWSLVQTPPLRDIGTCLRANAVVSFATSYKGPQLIPILQSFQRHASHCDSLFLFSDNCKALQLPVENRPDIATVECVPAIMVNPHFADRARVPILAEWSRANWRRFDYILHVDARDTFFFEDPFAPLYDLALQGIFAAAERRLITDESAGQTRMWIGSFSAASMKQDDKFTAWLNGLQLAGTSMPVICSGLFGGSSLAMADFLMTFSIALGDAPAVVRAIHGVDQGVLMYLFVAGLPYSRFRHRVTLFDAFFGPFTHFLDKDAVAAFTALGAPVNCAMRPYVIAHQLDRHQQLNWKLMGTLRPVAAVNTAFRDQASRQQYCHEVSAYLLPQRTLRGTPARLSAASANRFWCYPQQRGSSGRSAMVLLMHSLDAYRVSRSVDFFRRRFSSCNDLHVVPWEGPAAAAGVRMWRQALAAHNNTNVYLTSRDALAHAMADYDSVLIAVAPRSDDDGVLLLSGGVLDIVADEPSFYFGTSSSIGVDEERTAIASLAAACHVKPVDFASGNDGDGPWLRAVVGSGRRLGAAWLAIKDCYEKYASGWQPLIAMLWHVAPKRVLMDSRSGPIGVFAGAYYLSADGRAMAPCAGNDTAAVASVFFTHKDVKERVVKGADMVFKPSPCSEVRRLTNGAWSSWSSVCREGVSEEVLLPFAFGFPNATFTGE